jgi:hypothetical protein
MLGQRLRDLDRRGGSDLSVVVAAAGDRIDVRPEEQRVERRVASGATADDVPAKSMLGSSFAARIHSMTFARAAFVRRRCAPRATRRPLWVLAEFAERGEVRVDARSALTKVSLVGWTGRPVDRWWTGGPSVT